MSHSEPADSTQKERKEKKRRHIPIAMFFAAIFLVMLLSIGAIALKEYDNVSAVENLTESIQKERLPDFIEHQKTLLNIENLRRLTEVAYISDARRTRRSARIEAKALASESIYSDGLDFHKDALKVSHKIDEMVAIRDAMETIKKKRLDDSRTYFVKLTALARHIPDSRDKNGLFDFFFKDMVFENESVIDTKDETAYRNDLTKHLELVRNLAAQVSPPGRDTALLLAEDLKKLLASFTANTFSIKNSLRIVRELWGEIDASLRAMRDNVRQGSEQSINSALVSIKDASRQAGMTAVTMFGLIFFFMLLFFLVIHQTITKPLNWTSKKLGDLRAGKLDTSAPRIIISEIDTIAALLNRFSEHLSELYHQANMLEEEAALKKDLEEVMKAVFKASLDGYIIWNEKGIEHASVGTFNLFKAANEEELAAFFNDNNLGATLFPLLLAKARRLNSHREETSLTARDGQILPIEVTHIPMAYHGANCLLSYWRDLRPQKKTEEALLRAKEEADAATRAKSEFLANMSHEIRTPMNAILGLTHILLETQLTGHQKEYLTRVSDSAESLLRIINDILDFSKIEAGRLVMEKIEFQLENLLKSVLNFHSGDAEKKGLNLLLDGTPDLAMTLVGDPLRLRQILNNLLSNALKFTEKGGITLSAVEEGRSAGFITIRFSVRDTGIGLSQEENAKLFSAFSQADASTTRKYGGTGLGLAISKRFVEMMDGRIWCESRPQEGSTFYFTAVFGLASANIKLHKDPGAMFKGRLALILGGAPESLQNLTDHLKRLHFDPMGFSKSDEAETALANQTRPVDIAFIDSRDMDEKQLARIGGLLAGRQIPAVLVCPFSTKVVEGASLEGIKAILFKPITPSTLLTAVLTAFGIKADDYVDKAAEMPAPAATPDSLAGARILLAEDNEVNQLVAKKIMEKVGIVVQIAQNGLEALDMVQKEPFDLVLMDIQMPQMDGLEATRRIRALPGFNQLPIVAMTAHAMSGDRELSLAAGMNGHITKPINVHELFSTISLLLKK